MKYIRMAWLGEVAPKVISCTVDNESDTVTVIVEDDEMIATYNMPRPATAVLVGDLVIEVDDSPVEGQEFLGYINQYQQDRARNIA